MAWEPSPGIDVNNPPYSLLGPWSTLGPITYEGPPGRPAGGSPYDLYAGQQAALANATTNLSAQNILSQIRSRDAASAASMQNAQAAMQRAGLDAEDLRERIRQFDITTAEGKRQFDLDFSLDREKFELQRQQLQLQGAEAIINAPRGPADFFAYASRLPSVANAGGSALGNIFGQALQNVSGESLASLQQGNVLSNSQLATDLVRASQGGAVSDATSTFLRRSLGVNVPGATQLAQQQAQQAAGGMPGATGVPGATGMPGVPGAAPGAPNPLAPGLGIGGMGLNLAMQGQPQAGLPAGNLPMQTFDQWRAEQGYDIPTYSGGSGGDQIGQLAGYQRSSDPDIASQIGQPGMPSSGNYLPGVKRSYDIWELQRQYGEAQAARQYNMQQAQQAGAGAYMSPGAGGGAGGNSLYNALLQGGPSFMQRLGSLGGQIPRGYGTSIQEWNRFEPTAQAMYTGLLAEAGLETPEDFLAGVVKAAPNFGPSRMTRMR